LGSKYSFGNFGIEDSYPNSKKKALRRDYLQGNLQRLRERLGSGLGRLAKELLTWVWFLFFF
jgi:hypothetical protein